LVRPVTCEDPQDSSRVQKIYRDIDLVQARIRDLEEFDPQTVQRSPAPEVEALEIAIDETLSKVFGKDTERYGRYRRAAILDRSPLSRQPIRISRIRSSIDDGKSAAIILLRQAVRSLEEDITDFKYENTAVSTLEATKNKVPSKIFVVHGQDEAAHQGVARFLEKLDLNATILSEQPSQGRTIIEKFEQCASDVGFAVVLLTPDDVGGPGLAAKQGSRARQNVIFELGYFVAKLGRGKTTLLRKGGVEIPSDLYGIVYINFDVAGAWRSELARELKAAGIEFDAHKVWT